MVAAKKKADKKDPCEEERAKSKEIDLQVEELTKTKLEVEAQVDKLVKKIGNIVGPNTAPGNDEKDNRVERTWGEKPDISVTGDSLGHLHHH